MKFLPFIVVTQLGVAWALPANSDRQYYNPCPGGLYDVAFCCAQDVLGLSPTDCGYPTIVPISASDFQNTCAWIGKIAYCCVRPLFGAPPVFCTAPSGLGPYKEK